jgi:5-methylcytosine-specific restriction endonuclease McrA
MERDDEWKHAIFRRDGYICRYCGRNGCTDLTAYMILVPDHFIPTSKGGSPDPDNIVTACAICNNMKGQQVFATIEDAKKAIERYYEDVRLDWERNIKPSCGTFNANAS